MVTDIEAPLSDAAEQEGPLVEVLLELLSVDTRNPPGDTRELVGWIYRYLDELGLATEQVAVDPHKPNVVATLPGASDASLLYNGHVDTVPFDRTDWTVEPFGERRGDRVYGRGATDMKGQVAAMLRSAQAFVETGTVPPVSLTFAFVSDEETGGSAGLDALLDEVDIAADACVIGETTCSDGRTSITVADRGSIWLTLDAHGVAAHGSRPMLGENAIDRLYEAVTTLRTRFGGRRLSLDAEVGPIVDESVEYYEPILGTASARELFEYPTINLGTLRGGEAVNVVPRSATAEVDIRLTAGTDTAEVLADVRACVDEFDAVSLTDVSWSVGTFEPIDGPLVGAVTAVATGVTGQRVYRRSGTGGGDAKTLRNAGIPTVEFGLGTDTVHATDEYTTTDALVGNAAVYTRLPYALAERL